jgi:hypothetical protein
MNADDKPRRFTPEQIGERGKIDPAERSQTMQGTPLGDPVPTITQKEIEAPLDPKTSAQKRRANHYERITQAQARNEEEQTTFNGKQRHHRGRRRRQSPQTAITTGKRPKEALLSGNDYLEWQATDLNSYELPR